MIDAWNFDKDGNDMSICKVSVKSMQDWTYVYAIEADDAKSKGLLMHEEGGDSIDNWVGGETVEAGNVISSDE